MTRLAIPFFILILCFSGANAQTVILEQKVEDIDYEEGDFGPNLRHFFHSYISAGFVAGPAQTGADVRYFNSTGGDYGFRYKGKFTNVLSGGFDFVFRQHHFVLESDSGKMIGVPQINDWERISLTTFGPEIYQRINFDPRRGNFLGIFMDFGVGGAYNIGARNVYKNKLQGTEEERTVIRKLNYVNPFSAYSFVRVNKNRLGLKVNYRLTNLFKEAENLPELPRFWGGIELGVY